MDPHQPRAATSGFALRPDTWVSATESRPYDSCYGLGTGELAYSTVASFPEEPSSLETVCDLQRRIDSG